MRIAIQNCWPNMASGPEADFLRRLLAAAGRLGWEAAEVVTSGDILAFDPDCVLVTHEFQPKLTHHPAIGVCRTPRRLVGRDALRLGNILSYDGVIPGSEPVGRFLRDLVFAAGKDMPVAEFSLWPGGLADDPVAEDAVSALSLPGLPGAPSRFAPLLAALARRMPPPADGTEGWESALSLRLREAGVALCLHEPSCRADGLPSTAFLDAVASGKPTIVDDADFIRHAFRDTVLYVDPAADPADMAERIAGHVAWAQRHPAAAAARARRARAIFAARFSLDRQMERLPAFLEEVRERGGFTRQPRLSRTAPPEAGAAENRGPLVEYIVRAGSRPAAMVERCMRSLAAQTAGPVGVILVQYHPVDGLDEAMERWRPRFASFRHVRVPNTGLRSTSMWAGLRAVSAPFFGIHDDDDVIHPNHAASILDHFARSPDAELVYSGALRVEEDAGRYFPRVNFAGPLGREIPENRRVEFLDRFSAARLSSFDNYILSHSWLARRSLLKGAVLDDPEMEVGEDLYFYQLLAGSARFETTLRPTAEWHWRSAARANSMLNVSQDNWARDIERIRQRVRFQEKLPVSPTETPVGRASFTLGEPIDFRRPETQRFVLCGFSQPGADGIWSEGSMACLEFVVPSGSGNGLCMELTFIPVVTAQNGFVTIDVHADNHVLASWRHESWQEVSATVRIPTERLGGERLLLGFTITNTFNPSWQGDSLDDRDLGLLLKAIVFRAAPP
ncbi:glycosyltransferase family 2 protein [Azospirillum isscasi]|uniref:Glycosyltransferase family 2 protein n=1 Tax=Azospirillum isscasi TaxID=3053926 RepID=A0ABU0WKF9_9PROT|nr:glycosyltransferase family 2 protein [Azospirillum isscasi]MDQ2104718.1 glycosyltransferase family 2 protein [Azospirillum isscasi]